MNIIYRQEQALPTISGEVSGGGADVGPRIEEDLAFWSGRTERSPDAYETLQDYWDHVGYGARHGSPISSETLDLRAALHTGNMHSQLSTANRQVGQHFRFPKITAESA